MRLSKSVELGEGRTAVVHELRVRDVRALLTLLPDQATRGMDADALLGALQSHLPDLLRLCGDTLTLPPDTSLDDLALSEVQALGAVWWELHRDFFELLAGRAAAPPASTRSAA